MAKIYVIHCTEGNRIPPLTPEQAAGLKKAIGETSAKMPKVKFAGVMANPDTGIGVGEFDAPDAKAVEEFLKAIGITGYDVVVPVQPLEL